MYVLSSYIAQYIVTLTIFTLLFSIRYGKFVGKCKSINIERTNIYIIREGVSMGVFLSVGNQN